MRFINPISRNFLKDLRTVLSLTPKISAILVAVARPLVSMTFITYSSVLVRSNSFTAAMDLSENFVVAEGLSTFLNEACDV